MRGFSFALAVLLWGVLPGVALLFAVRIRWSLVQRLAAAPGVSLALGAAAAYLAEALGLSVSPLPVLGLIAVICAVAAVPGLKTRPAGDAAVEDPVGRVFRPGRIRPPEVAGWLIFLLPIAVVLQLEPLSSKVLLPPTLHDGLDHANWFRLIYDLHSVNPHEVMAPPLAPDGSPTYYPWGLHAWMALVARTTSLDPTLVLMRSLLFVSAVLPLSIYVFAVPFVGRGWPAATAAGFSLMFWWLPFQVWGWGGYPLLAGAVAALPIARLAVDGVASRGGAAGAHVVDDEGLHYVRIYSSNWAAFAAAGLCGVGLLVVHPSQAFVALIVAVVVSGTLAAQRMLPWWTPFPFVAALMVTAGALAFGDVWAPLDAFLERARAVGATVSGDPRYRWPGGIYHDTVLQFPAVRRVGFGVLCVAGAIVALFNPSARPLLALHVVFSLLVPLAASQTWATSLWYHAPERIWYAQYASLPMLAALGVAAIVSLLDPLAARIPALARLGSLRSALAWMLVLLALFYGIYAPFRSWGNARMFLFAERNQELTVTDRRLLADFEWIRANVPRGEVLFNAPADWGLTLPFTGHRTIFWSGGSATGPGIDWHAVVAVMRGGGVDASHAAAELSRLGLSYVYAAQVDPRMEAGNRMALDGRRLAGADGLDLLYSSPTAHVFRVAQDRGEALGLDDSDRIQYLGFHGRERLGTHRWRWTTGLSSVRMRASAAGDCYVRVLGPAPGTYELRLQDTALALTARGYRIPATAHRGDVIQVEIASEASVPAKTGKGRDTRSLGVKVRDITLDCDARSSDG